MARNPGRAGGLVAVLALSIATSAAALQQPARPVTTTAVPTATRAAAPAAAPRTYDECLRSYAGRTDPTAYCRRLFPDTAPSTTVPGAATTPDGPATQPPTREPVDITPQLDKLLDAWRNRPRTPPATPGPPADPLAVIPEIQAACATYAAAPERWRRCTADGWRDAGLRGRPPLALQTPPAVEPPRVQPPVQPPPVQSRPAPSRPVQSKPPIQTPPALAPKPLRTEPVRPAPVAEPQPPSVAVVEPPAAPKPPPTVAPPVVPPTPPPASKGPAIPLWLWLVALAAAAGGGFGLARWLGRAKPAASPPPCAPEIALVADPGVVVLTPDGSPRAGMAVSLRFEHAAEAGELRLDYPLLETAP
ncbi:hypothetical protein [Caulobacter sp. UNC279MFTsu5.1]|uniref:hypothetical protein n=1 Tax=Caulobacter sp. UNC279MFTsu5.1 TaxID=1502775 RepID=UPI0008F2A01B|nr:hypothetical protein [Caulobacter sp. UNC279MFTsu5.1]SFJ07495.1 hypothetical protein SAMN02799626_01094 [Caulobacter sp. UNC279MFTsu5.1]